MLTESFIAAISTPTSLQKPVSASVVGAKDGSIFSFRIAPAPVQCTGLWKKSISGPHCLAVTKNHIFTSQVGKSVLHVYGRERMVQEATVAFPQRITCVVTGADETVLAMGTEGGSIIVWEIYTGRTITIPDCHLQPITCLSVDPTSSFLLSSSADSNIHVWNLVQLRQFTPSTSFSSSSVHTSLIQTLSAHKKRILAIAVGHSRTTAASIAVSISDDKAAIVWDFLRGVTLRTYLLHSVPIGLALDPLDRGFYVSYADGSVQQINFYDPANLVSDPSKIVPVEAVAAVEAEPAAPSNSGSKQQKHLLIAPTESSKWVPSTDSLGPALSLTLSWDGTRLLSGHSSGVIGAWDVATGSFTTLTTLPGPVTCLGDLPPKELLASSSRGVSPITSLASTTIVKPRLDLSADVATKQAVLNGNVPLNYALSVQLNRPGPVSFTLSGAGVSSSISSGGSPWDDYYRHTAETGFDLINSVDFIRNSLTELEKWTSSNTDNSSSNSRVTVPSSSTRDSCSDFTSKANSSNSDFMAFDQPSQGGPDGSGVNGGSGHQADLAPEVQIKLLKEKVGLLEKREGILLNRVQELDDQYTAAVRAWQAASERR